MPSITFVYGFEAIYHGHTDTLGSRITVRSNGGKRRSFGYDHAAPCAFKAAIAQYIAEDRARPALDRRFTHPPDGIGWTLRTVFDTSKGYVVIAYWIEAVQA